MDKINIVALPQFQKEIKQLSKKYISIPKDFKTLLADLTTKPIQGDSLGNNCYKVRMNITSKNAGKRGGARVITCVKLVESTLYLVSIFDKSDRETITQKDIESILKLSGVI
jgi:hypothetical protein